MIIGIDEVGRGCWAGPLVAGAVELSEPIDGLTDSKLLSKKKREQLDLLICEQAIQFSLGWVWPAEIDELGLTEAVRLAMRRAVEKLTIVDKEVVVDGNINYLSDIPGSSCIIKADLTMPEVSAASIIAKVARDTYMAGLAAEHQQYGFESHVGYGTKQHMQALASLGAIHDVHRMSYRPVARYVQ